MSEKRKALLQSAGYTETDLKPKYHCNDCHDTGFLNDQKCHCLKRMISEAYMARFNLADGIRGQTFETFDEKIFSKEDQAYAALYRKLGKKICDEIDQNDENYIFIGEPGRGKTFLCSCIVNRLIELGQQVIYISAIQLVDLARKHAALNRNDQDEDLYEILTNCDLLIIDDLGTEHQTDFSNATLFAIVNARQLLHRKTIISTNLKVADIANRYEPRFSSRLGGCYKQVLFKGADLRNQVK